MNDPSTAINAIHQLISLEPNEKKWRDSLAVTYFRANNPEQAFLAAKTALGSAQKNPSEQLLRVAAESSKVLGLQDESLKYHLRLLEHKPNSIVLLYDIGLLYFSVFQVDVGIEYMDRVIANEVAKSQNLTLYLKDNSSQDVTYYAAAHNVKGYGYTELRNFVEAEKALQMALSEEPDFINAKANMGYMLQLKNTDQ